MTDRLAASATRAPWLSPGAILSYVIAALAAVASAGGLLADGLYRDNAFVASTWVGNDAVTLAVAVPLLVAATVLAGRGSLRAHLVWVGMLDYMLYNFAFYLFGAAFNVYFLVYAALLGLSVWALALALMSLDVERVGRSSGSRTPVRAIAGYMLFVGIGLALVYVMQWFAFATGGDVPLIVTKSGHPTNVVFALDLSIVIPVLIVGGLWIWRRRPWGYVLAAMVNVKGAVYMLALCAATITAARAGTVPNTAELALWAPIGAGAALAVFFQLRALRES
jgi:hypothetical protein